MGKRLPMDSSDPLKMLKIRLRTLSGRKGTAARASRIRKKMDFRFTRKQKSRMAAAIPTQLARE